MEKAMQSVWKICSNLLVPRETERAEQPFYTWYTGRNHTAR